MTTPFVVKASNLTGNTVVNADGEDLGTIKEIMIDTTNGTIAYAVLSFGGFLGIGDDLYAIPWQALEYDTENEHYMLDIDKETLENAQGFDQDEWPDTANSNWHVETYKYYGYDPYWM